MSKATKASIDELRVVARAYAKRYSGKVKSGEYLLDGLPPCLYEVTGRFRGRPLKFRIFDGGCVIEGETQRVASGAISVNRKAVRATVPVPLVVSGWAPRVFREKSITDSEARAALAEPRAWQALSNLHLTPDQLVAIVPQPYWGNSKEPTFLFVYSDEGGPDFPGLDARLDVLARLFPWRVERIERAVAREYPVFSTNAYRIRIGARMRSSNAAAPHTFGGTLDHDLKCRNCRSPIHLLLTIDTRASELKLRPVGRRDFRIVYCLNCMSFPGLLYIDYSKPKLRVISQDKEQPVNEDGPFRAAR